MSRRKRDARPPTPRRAQALPNQQPETPPAQTPFERELTTKRRGELSELAFTLAATRRGYVVSKPFGDSQRYDVILDPSRTETSPDVIPNRAESPVRNLLSPTDALLSSSPVPYSLFPDSWRGQAQDFRRFDHYSHFASAGNRPNLARVQVKSSTQLVNGLYRINSGRRLNGRVVPYRLSEVDFIAAYIIPEDSWFILPLAHVLGQISLLFRPKNSPLPGLYDSYREAWHYLHEPTFLEFA
jgi:hypothetical protein